MQVYETIHELGEAMEPDGFELHIFRYVLEPLFSAGLPEKKRLHELCYDVMVPHFGMEQAMAHLWFGVNAIGKTADGLLSLFETDTHLAIENGEVMYRKLLAELALRLGSNNSEKLIHFIISTKKLKGCSVNDFMPPEEKRGNNNAFVPCVLRLFKVADEQCIIDPQDLSALRQWLSDRDLIKLSRMVENFKADGGFKKVCEYCSYRDYDSLEFSVSCHDFMYSYRYPRDS